MTDSEHYQDKIGFLNHEVNLDFEGGSLSVLSAFKKLQKSVMKYSHQDGFLYPPLSRRVTVDESTQKAKRIPNTERPILIHRMPASHLLSLDNKGTQEQLRHSEAGFVVQLLAYLYGTRLQFWDWWLDGRIPIRPTHNLFVRQKQAERFLSNALQTWRNLNERLRIVVTNLLYMHNRAGTAEWDWEKLLLEFIVTDACCIIGEGTGAIRKTSKHLKQIQKMCSMYEVRYEEKWIALSAKLRHNLVHTSLWDGGQPGTARSSDAFWAPLHLRRFNHRLIAAMLVGPSTYSSSTWLSISHMNFNISSSAQPTR